MMVKPLFNSFLRVTFLFFALGIGVALAGSAPLPFKSASLQKILQSRTGEPFLLVLWSLTCPPCHRELDLLAEMHRQHPELNLVLISTDGWEQADEVQTAVERHGLGEVESWLFAGPTQRLRYEIDPAWYGVLPRSYLYDANHKRAAVTGGLEKEQILAWLDYVK